MSHFSPGTFVVTHIICLKSPGQKLFVYAFDRSCIWSWTVAHSNKVIMGGWICVRPIWQRQTFVLGLKFLWSHQWWKQSAAHSVTLYPCVELVHWDSRGRELAHGHEIFKNQIFVGKQSNKPRDTTFRILTLSKRQSLHCKTLKTMQYPSISVPFSLYSPANCAYRCTSMDTWGRCILQIKSFSYHHRASETDSLTA